MSVKLANRLVEALVDLKRHEDQRRTYWWRQASMRELSSKGYVVAWHPANKLVKHMAHKLTDHGREFLAGFPASGASS